MNEMEVTKRIGRREQIGFAVGSFFLAACLVALVFLLTWAESGG